MASQVGICNLALSKFGSKAITSLNDGTPEARYCSILWDLVRDELLYSHPWNFAMTRAELAQSADTPAFEWDYQYTLPTDCLRAWEIYDSNANWVIEGRNLLTNDEEVYLRYIKRVTDVTQFTPAFTMCFALKLAAELATKLGQSKSTQDTLLQEFREYIRTAYKFNAIEGKRPLEKDEQGADSGNYSWQTEGR